MRDVAPDALISLGATSAAAATRAGTCIAEALTSACLARIDAREPTVRAFVDVQRDRALAEARDLDRRAAGERGPLHGVPVAVKEVFDVAGMICAWGTPIREDPVSRKDAVVVARLRAAGAVIVGTTVSTEYAVWTAGPTTNPHDPGRTPGGSSSGSAAAVAAGMVPLTIGSQTIGSVVRPAVYCGVLGMKPTKGAISTVGGMALSAFLDHVGFLARNVDDLVVACQVLFASDPRDQYSEDVSPPFVGRGRRRLQVLLVDGPMRERIETATRVALERARAAFEIAGARVREVELSDRFAAARDCLFSIQRYGIARNHGADRDRAGGRMSAFVRNVIDAGRKISKADYNAVLEEAPVRFGNVVVAAAMLVDGVATRPYRVQRDPGRRRGVGVQLNARVGTKTLRRLASISPRTCSNSTASTGPGASSSGAVSWATRCSTSSPEPSRAQSPSKRAPAPFTGEYQEVWGADLCGQVSQRSLWLWSLRIPPRIEVAIAARPHRIWYSPLLRLPGRANRIRPPSPRTREQGYPKVPVDGSPSARPWQTVPKNGR